MKTVDNDPMFDKKRAQKKLRAFVESDSYTISQKAEMMVEHFHEQVIAKGKIGGQARAMVVTASIPRCVEYYYAINKCLASRHSPYKAIVAFSGEHKYQGQEPALTSAAINGFSDAEIPDRFEEDPYRLLVVADMFQTGFDEPLLHTMYVDKMLYDIKAVQTLSRLNRACPKKYDTFGKDYPLTKYEALVEAKIRDDIKAEIPHILQKIKDNNLGMHSFYFYVLPFNDAEDEKKSIMEAVLKGDVDL